MLYDGWPEMITVAGHFQPAHLAQCQSGSPIERQSDAATSRNAGCHGDVSMKREDIAVARTGRDTGAKIRRRDQTSVE